MKLKQMGITFSIIALLSFNGCGTDDSGTTTTSTNEIDNIAKSSTLNYELVDGKKENACVNNASFGAGFNPDEEIVATFDNSNIDKIVLYFGQSEDDNETGSGYIEAQINGSYEKVATFENYGWSTNKFFINLDNPIETDSIKIHMTEGGGEDKNLCVNEVEIYTVAEK